MTETTNKWNWKTIVSAVLGALVAAAVTYGVLSKEQGEFLDKEIDKIENIGNTDSPVIEK